MNDDDVNILAAGGARYVAGPTETGATIMWGGGQSHTLSKTFSFKRPLIALPPIF